MAWEVPILQLPKGIAGSDFSTGNGYKGTGQYLIVKLSADNTYVPCTAVTDHPAGISQTNPKSGGALAVMAFGVSKVMTGSGGLTAGQEYGTDASGLAVAKTTLQTGGALDNYVLGFCLEAGAAGALATVTVSPAYRIY